MRFRAYKLIEMAVEDGVRYGIQRAYKHTEHPSEEVLQTEIERAVMTHIHEIIDFDKEDVSSN